MEGAFGPEPLEHSVLKIHLDSRPSRNELNPEPLENSVPDRAPCRGVGFYDSQTVSDPLEHSRTCTNDDSVPKSASSELAEHSTSIIPQSWGEGFLSKTDTASRPQPAGLPGVTPEPQQVEDPPWKDQQETTESRPESGEAIVVGAIGSAVPWFLTGWAHEVEIEFMIDMIDMGLVSPDSSPLIVQGQLELAIVFPGLDGF